MRFGSEKRFKIDVESPAYEEGWADEMIMFHNPRALRAVDPILFPKIGRVHVDDDDHAETGPLRVLWSQTTTHDFLARRDGHPTWTKYPSEEEPSYTSPR